MVILPEKLFELVTASGGSFKVHNLESAYSFCKSLTLDHYENFPVASLLIPKQQRHHIYAIYSFARIADDIADELIEISSEQRQKALNDFLNILEFAELSELGNPVIMALYNSINELNLPLLPFSKLIEAFMLDSDFRQPETFDDLLDYCSCSANPVGELVLRVFNNYDDKTAFYSDNICTGLQLVNFWQDLSVDLKRGRCYIPLNLLKKYNVEITDLENLKNTDRFSRLLDELYEFTCNFFKTGRNLIGFLNSFRLRIEIKATVFGGLKILEKLKSLGINVLFNRPKLNKKEYFSIIVKSIFG